MRYINSRPNDFHVPCLYCSIFKLIRVVKFFMLQSVNADVLRVLTWEFDIRNPRVQNGRKVKSDFDLEEMNIFRRS